MRDIEFLGNLNYDDRIEKIKSDILLLENVIRNFIITCNKPDLHHKIVDELYLDICYGCDIILTMIEHTENKFLIKKQSHGLLTNFKDIVISIFIHLNNIYRRRINNVMKHFLINVTML